MNPELGRPRPLRLAIKGTLFAFITTILLTLTLAPSYTRHPTHYRSLIQQCNTPTPTDGCANPNNQTVFISTILYDPDGNLANGLWGQRLLSIIHLLGPPNVFLSIYENDSGEQGQKALEHLKAHVPCENHIVSEPHVSLAGLPTITLPDGSRRVKRIAYLAELRNRALRPLDNKFDPTTSTKFDKILFMNDVAFDPIDAAHLLLNTNNGNYLAACAVDFFQPHKLYDVYALRDADGYASYQTLFPFFENRGRGLSRADVLAQKDAVRVKSCWGGMVAVQGKYVQNMDSQKALPAIVGGHTIDPDNPLKVSTPIRFRHEPEPFYDACECCLFSADLTQAAKLDSINPPEIYINPYIRVAYKESVFKWIPFFQQWERLFTFIHDLSVWLSPEPQNPWREVEERQGKETFTEEVWDNEASQQWKLVERIGRSGLFCGIRGMQIMRAEGARRPPQNKNMNNWVNTKLPPGQNLELRESVVVVIVAVAATDQRLEQVT
ncbi:glycosyltransferase family 69 protein [Podospora fimiseda]|uniref:Glycosyltransferase family 69 protein n=1 Tax=Podospora fimiseda TaxID=252190 RepID=A0AAN7BZF0_9PEZI|nr:glycosyltransferase family 69 protein [Podospora fimiseda]